MNADWIAACVIAAMCAGAGGCAQAETMDRLAERYVKLVLAVGQHDPDYVDAYYGPPEWRKEADASKRAVSDIDRDAADLLKAWIPTAKMKVTGGQLRDATAILEVEGELFPGQLGMSIVQMVKTGGVWKFDRASRAGMVR